VNYFSQPKGTSDVKGVKQTAGASRRDAAAGQASPEMVSTFGAGMMVTGNIVCPGALQIYGRVNGDILASHLVVCAGAQVEGKIIAQEAVIQGAFNGTIHGNNVRLEGTAVVDGEIFNKSLTIEQDALFEGMSRRLERPVEAPSADKINGAAPGKPILVASSETAG
jgi:cytoskeletal protein CcmA (bactofilin family)